MVKYNVRMAQKGFQFHFNFLFNCCAFLYKNEVKKLNELRYALAMIKALENLKSH